MWSCSTMKSWTAPGTPKSCPGRRYTPLPGSARWWTCFDALTSERSYRPRSSPFEACRIMRNETYRCFDPKILNVFINLLVSTPN